MEKFWLCLRLTGNARVKSRVPRHRHKTIESAERECERLAGVHPGVPFAILETVGLRYAPKPATCSEHKWKVDDYNCTRCVHCGAEHPDNPQF